MSKEAINKVEYFKECYDTMEDSIDQQQSIFNRLCEDVELKKAERDISFGILKRMKGSLITFQALINKESGQ